MTKEVLVGVLGEKTIDRVTLASDTLPTKPGMTLLIQRSWLTNWIPCTLESIETQGNGEKVYRVKKHYP